MDTTRGDDMIRINDFNLKAVLKAAVLWGGFLFLAASLGFGQQMLNLTAGHMTLTLPDGSSVPMWGYSCGAVASGGATVPVTCNYLSTGTNTPPVSGWSPVVITVPVNSTGATSLTINLTNNLLFQPATPVGATPNAIPTSLMIVGQVGGGLCDVTKRTTTLPPDHSAAHSDTTWFIAHTGPQGTPPQQSARVQSFGTEVTAGATTPTALTWSNLAPGTYLLESGTHPSIQVPMGLMGVLVVTSAPTTSAAGTAYPGVSYNAEIPLEFSEIDPVQNRAVDAAVRTAGFSESATYGTFTGTSVSHINVTSGGAGYTVPPNVTIPAPAGATPATATAVIDTDPTSSTYQQVLFIVVNNGRSGY